METINKFEELVNNPKYQNIFKTYKYDMRKITKILKLEQMGVDIGFLDNKQFARNADPLDILLLYCKDREQEFNRWLNTMQGNCEHKLNNSSTTKVPFAEDGVHGVNVYNAKGEWLETELTVDTEDDDSDDCEFSNEEQPPAHPVVQPTKTEVCKPKMIEVKNKIVENRKKRLNPKLKPVTEQPSTK